MEERERLRERKQLYARLPRLGESPRRYADARGLLNMLKGETDSARLRHKLSD